MKVNIPVEINLDYLINNLDQMDALKLIHQIDRRFAAVDFSLDLIHARLEDLKADLDLEDKKNLLEIIENVKKLKENH